MLITHDEFRENSKLSFFSSTGLSQQRESPFVCLFLTYLAVVALTTEYNIEKWMLNEFLSSDVIVSE